MSIKDEKQLRLEAYDNIYQCCQTLCHRDPVIEYIKHLEMRVKELENGSSERTIEHGH